MGLSYMGLSFFKKLPKCARSCWGSSKRSFCLRTCSRPSSIGLARFFSHAMLSDGARVRNFRHLDTKRLECSSKGMPLVAERGQLCEVLRKEHDDLGGGKLLLRFRDTERSKSFSVETVIIVWPRRKWEETQRASVCVSSQGGCAMACRFCDTGSVQPVINLPAWSIVAQVQEARNLFPELSAGKPTVTFMGMGEPLMNYQNVIRAIKQLQADDIAVDARSVTVSTVGVAPRIPQLAKDLPGVGLAVSLHAPSQNLREQILPVAAARWPLPELMNAVGEYEHASDRRVMFQYICLGGINDTDQHAEELSVVLKSACSRQPMVNLIPYNETEVGRQQNFQTPSDERMKALRSSLRNRGVRATIRWSTAAGRPISAACGQLAAVEHRILKAKA